MEQQKLFYNNVDIQRLYGISRKTAYDRMKKIREVYEIDESRLPKKGLLPTNVVRDFFKQSGKKQKSKGEVEI